MLLREGLTSFNKNNRANNYSEKESSRSTETNYYCSSASEYWVRCRYIQFLTVSSLITDTISSHSFVKSWFNFSYLDIHADKYSFRAENK